MIAFAVASNSPCRALSPREKLSLVPPQPCIRLSPLSLLGTRGSLLSLLSQLVAASDREIPSLGFSQRTSFQRSLSLLDCPADTSILWTSYLHRGAK